MLIRVNLEPGRIEFAPLASPGGDAARTSRETRPRRCLPNAVAWLYKQSPPPWAKRKLRFFNPRSPWRSAGKVGFACVDAVSNRLFKVKLTPFSNASPRHN
ncbi:hypothetical protein GS682_24920 [Nostoc sp. B(2019)]|nr:hypothetical protein [Nostoc sp. B(2019)]